MFANLSYSHEDIIRESWNQCINYGLSSMEPPKLNRISYGKWKDLLEEHKDILEISEEYRENLWTMIRKGDYIYGLADKDGTLFLVEGNSKRLKEMGYNKGYTHKESNMGTNAINTCLDTGKPVIVWGKEHFLESLKGWVGFAAPIYMNDNHLEVVVFIMLPVEKSNTTILNDVIVTALNTGQRLQLIKDKQELMCQSEKRKATNDSIVQTTSIIAHEVRNALTNISAFIQLLQLDKSIDDNKGNNIIKEINRVGKLFDDLKLFTGVQDLEINENLAGDIMDSVLDMMMTRVDNNKINLIFNDYVNEIPIVVDKNAFHSVFINLIENAIQAMEYEGTLTIDLDIDKKTNEALISFKNTGPGIPKDEIDKIFKLFHTTKREGSGIGLYVCQTIVQHHGGKIEVHSDGNKGATFIVRLPISKQ